MIRKTLEPTPPNPTPKLTEFLISYGKQAIYLLEKDRKKTTFKDPDKDYKQRMIIAIHRFIIEVVKKKSGEQETDLFLSISFNMFNVYHGMIQLNWNNTNHFPPSDIQRVLGMKGIINLTREYTEIINFHKAIDQV